MLLLNRRNFGAVSVATAGLAIGRNATAQTSATGLEISRENAAIHQEIAFAAKPARVYDALLQTAEFDRVVRASAVMIASGMVQLGSEPTLIEAQPGGKFVLFGGDVTGRIIELVPNARIVQAWRTASWDAGIYSIAFALSDASGSTQLHFDHTGFPSEAADHLANGWHSNYWEPLAKVLAAP